MKIAMIGQKGIPAAYGGIERHVEELSSCLAKKGHEVLVYARAWYTPTLIKNYRNVKIIHSPALHTKHLDAITHTFTATIHSLKQNADIIHYHGVGPSLLSFIPRLLSPQTKVVATFHCIDRHHQKWGAFARLMLRVGEWTACRFAHETIAVSKSIQHYCLNEYQKLTTYIPNGAAAVTAPGELLISQWGLEKNKYLLMVSRLVRHKGAHYLLAAWQIARARRPELFADYKLVIAGDAAFTGDYVAELKKFARGDSSIIFTGWQKGQALAELYGNTALLIHPSENEGLPLTVLQAMSYGLPALVSDIPEHKELITDSRFWFNGADAMHLARKIIELIGTPEILTLAGQKNLETVTRDYNWGDIAEKTEAVYAQPAKATKRLQIA